MKKIIILTIFSFISLYIYAQSQPRCNHHASVVKATTSDTLDVLHYDINLDLIYLSKQSISGNAKLSLTTRINGMTQITLDLLKLNIDSILIGGQVVNTWVYNDTLLRYSLASVLNIGDTISSTIYYHGHPVKDPSGWGGFYFSNDSSFAFNLGIGMQDNPHNYGRVWFPCVDDFVDRATYNMSISVKNGKVAVCNGTLESTMVGNDATEYRWKLHHDIPAYLAAVAVGPYVAVLDTFNGVLGAVPISLYVKANMVNQTNASFANLKQILTAFEQYYGPYRWERVGYVGVPFSSGAMEHATNIAIGLGYIDGTLTHETLFAHELSHHWFGDLVTCSKASDMWLNEGWAVFSESMYQEMVYGKVAYKNNMRGLVYDVLKNTYRQDGGYYALTGIPHNLTYGATIYDKGGTVAHSVRGYLGDDAFFSMLNAYMTQKAFSDQSSDDFRDFISTSTGINMNDFFSAWVDEPGFVHFSIDSFYSVPNTISTYDVNVSIRQRLKHKPNFANSNRVPITFMDDQWNRLDTIVQFSGETGSQWFNLNFKPTAVFCDFDERFADATTDYSLLINQTGLVDLPFAYSKVDIKQISDSAILQMTHNWVAPDTLGITYPGLRISTNHYWTVNSIRANKFDATISFRYFKGVDFDIDIIKNKDDSLVMLYRPHGAMPWQRVKFQKNGNWIAGYMEVEHAQNGDYVLAAYDYKCLGINEQQDDSKKVKFSVSPNPSNGYFNFELEYPEPTYIIIYDLSGKQVANLDMITESGKSNTKWNPEGLAPAQYLLVLFNQEGKSVHKTSIIISE